MNECLFLIRFSKLPFLIPLHSQASSNDPLCLFESHRFYRLADAE